MKGNRLFSLLLSALVIVSMGMASVPMSPVSAGPAPSGQAQGTSGETLGYDPDTGHLIFIGAPAGSAIASLAGDLSALSTEQQADSFVAAYGSAFGLSNPSQELVAQSSADGDQVTRYQQTYQGIPVFGGNLVVSTTEQGGLVAMAGKVSAGLNVNVAPSISAESAAGTALGLVAKLYELNPSQITADAPALWIYDEKMFTESAFGPQLVWKVEVTAAQLPIREVVMVNAQYGKISQHYNEIDTAWVLNGKLGTRKPSEPQVSALAGGTPLWSIYTDHNQWGTLPGDFICNQASLSCFSDPQALDARDFTLDTYNFYWDILGRDGIDDAGMPIISTIHYGNSFSSGPTKWYRNAYWDGFQMVYGDRVGVDDVVAHELTHGVTDYTSELIYLYQSGAINESISDVMGELVDLSNVDDYYVNDTTGRWLIGESIEGAAKSFRNMKNPPAFKSPDKMTSALYYKGAGDNGGVHTNSGVNNKAAYLMTDGGVFNGQTVTGIGINKVAKIYYKAQTDYLFPGADYLDLYYALKGACSELVGLGDVTLDNCAQVDKATKAVEMHIKPATVTGPVVDACPVGYSEENTLFTEDFESGTGNWVLTGTGTDLDIYGDLISTDPLLPPSWGDTDILGMPNPMGEGTALWGGGPAELNDYLWDQDWRGYWYRDYFLDYASEEAALSSFIPIPTGQTYLTFDHLYLFESYGPTSNFDGGVLEYNDGSGWKDAKPLFSLGTNYNGTVVNYGTKAIYQPLSGKSAFVANSLNGVVTARYNLSSLAGKNVYLRFRTGYDNSTDWGWFIDNVDVHTCVASPAIPLLSAPADKALTTIYTPTLDWTDTSLYLDHYEIQINTDPGFGLGTMFYDDSTGTTSSYTTNPLDPNTTYYWRVRSLNSVPGTKGWSLVRSLRTAIEAPELSDPSFIFPAGTPALLDTKRPTLTWDSVAGATTYTVEAAVANTFAVKAINFTTAATSYTHKADLLAGTIYYWRVKANTAVGGRGPSGYSEIWKFKTANPSSIPALIAPLDNALVPNLTPLLDWGATVLPPVTVLNPVTTFDSYEVQVDTSPSFGVAPVLFYPAAPGITNHAYTFGVGELQPNTTYYWRVRAINTPDGGTTTWSNGWSLVRKFRTQIIAPVLSAPADLLVLDNKRPNLQWAAVPGALTYTVEAALLSDFKVKAINATVATTNYTHTADLMPDKPYFWRVRVATATEGRAPGVYSDIWEFTTALVSPPTVPALVAPAVNALLTDYTPKLDWGNSILPLPANSTTFASYRVQVDDANDFSTPEVDASVGAGNLATSEYEIPVLDSLAPNTTYYWRVNASNTNGNISAWSLVRSFRTAIVAPALSAPPFVFPAGTPALLNTKRPTLQWLPVADATTYTVEAAVANTFAVKAINFTTAAGVTSYTHTADLLAGTTYYWRVKANTAVGGRGPSAYSEIWQFKTGNPPSIPVPVTPVNKSLVTTYIPTLNWNDSTLSPAYYQLQLDNDANFSSPVIDVNDNSIVISQYPVSPALDPNTTYYWRVKALNTLGDVSAWSAVFSFRTVLDTPVLIDPANDDLTTTYRPIFDWDGVNGAVSYTIQVSTSPTFVATVPFKVNLTPVGTETSFAPLANLPKGPLFWRVRANSATGGNGPSPWSATGNFSIVNLSSGGLDSDGDGLPNDWEINGYDLDGDGDRDPLPGANPLRKDIYIEMDYMAATCGPDSGSYLDGLAPNADVKNAIVAVFANAPVANPAGGGGNGITIHLEDGNEVMCDPDLAPVDAEFYALKEANFEPGRAAVYHYMIWAVGYEGGTSSGLSFGIPATDFIVTLGSWGTGGTDENKIGTFIHELGHNLNLTHGGVDHNNYKPNYLSVMNYFFTSTGVYRNGTWGDSTTNYLNFDYQRITTAALNESSLSEITGLGAAAAGYGTMHTCPYGWGTNWDDWNLPKIDWNCDGDYSDTGLKIDVNDDGRLSSLVSQNNWQFIVYNGGGIIGSGASPQVLLSVARNTPIIEWDELTLEKELEIHKLKMPTP